MKATSSPKKIDTNSYNASSEDFIPVACHYDQHTLLTKNGELIQTFQINGINSEKISKTLFNLRKVVRQALKENIKDTNYAIWIHTIRRKANLDDPSPYHSFFSANIHEIWAKKNYWHDKYVNRLYISVVHSAPSMQIKDFNSLVNSLSSDVIANFEENFHAASVKALTSVVDSMLDSLSEFGARKLGIKIDGNLCYSEPMFLYRSIIQLDEEPCLTPVTDIATALSSHQYAVGNDMMEVIDHHNKKFAAMMSLKDYQDVSSEALDKFLQIPVEMIATEVFYFVDQEEITKHFEHQKHILTVSKNEELLQLKGLDKIFSNVNSSLFCQQQISFMIIGDNIQELNAKIKQASERLAKIGIVHVREDINLEKVFWGQLPGNFSFLTRMIPTLLDNTAAMASLHNFPTGNQYNYWGKAITLLRTEKGTPYFMNFHDNTGDGFAAIFGGRKSGCTTMMNFFLSEADKLKPTIVHFVEDLASGIYAKAKDAIWRQRVREIVNPFFVEDTLENRETILEFFRIIANHYFDPLSDEQLIIIKSLVDYSFILQQQDRLLSRIINNIDFEQPGAQELWTRLSPYVEGGMFYQVFEKTEPLDLKPGDYFCFNLLAFSDEEFTQQNYPKEKRLIHEFEYKLNSLRSVKAGLIYAITREMKNLGDDHFRILAIDDLAKILHLKHYHSLIQTLHQEISVNKGVFFATFKLEDINNLYLEGVDIAWIKKIGTKFIIPPEIRMQEIEHILGLNKAEVAKLFDLTPSVKSFLISQDGKTIASELSIGGFTGLTRILSCTSYERETYYEVIREHGEDVENWLPILYDKFNSL